MSTRVDGWLTGACIFVAGGLFGFVFAFAVLL